MSAEKGSPPSSLSPTALSCSATIFIAFSSRHALSNLSTLLLSRSRAELLFLRLSVSRATTAGSASARAVYQFPREFATYYRRCIENARRGGKIDERVGDLSYEEKRDEANRRPPSSSAETTTKTRKTARTVVALRVFRRRVRAIFLALFNKRDVPSLSRACDMPLRYRVSLFAVFTRDRSLSGRVDRTFAIDVERENVKEARGESGTRK